MSNTVLPRQTAAKSAYMVDTSTTGTTYVRESSATDGWIRRITEVNGVITVEKAFGKWNDRATLTYHPIDAVVGGSR